MRLRVLIAPDGVPLGISVLETTLTPAVTDKKTRDALEVEAVRVAQLLRFQPVVSAVDTLIVPVVYRIL